MSCATACSTCFVQIENKTMRNKRAKCLQHLLSVKRQIETRNVIIMKCYLKKKKKMLSSEQLRNGIYHRMSISRFIINE